MTAKSSLRAVLSHTTKDTISYLTGAIKTKATGSSRGVTRRQIFSRIMHKETVGSDLTIWSRWLNSGWLKLCGSKGHSTHGQISLWKTTDKKDLRTEWRRPDWLNDLYQSGESSTFLYNEIWYMPFFIVCVTSHLSLLLQSSFNCSHPFTSLT